MTGTIILRNDSVSASILPQEGARVSSLKSVKSEVEFLAQPYRRRSLLTPSLSALFEHGSCAGIEECLPSVGPCGADTDGGAVPDHGDFWQIDWQVTSKAATALSCFASGFSRSIRLKSTFNFTRTPSRFTTSFETWGPKMCRSYTRAILCLRLSRVTIYVCRPTSRR